MKKIDKNSFTLIELIIVIVILGVLAGAMVPLFSKVSNDAKISKAKAELDAIRSATNMFYADVSHWPTYYEVAYYPPIDTTLIKGKMCMGASIPNWNGPYLSANNINDPWGNSYLFCYASSTKALHVLARPWKEGEGPSQDEVCGSGGPIDKTISLQITPKAGWGFTD